MSQGPLFIVFSNLGLGGIQKKIVDIVNLLAKKNPRLPIYILLRRREDYDLSGQIKNLQVRIINYDQWARVKTPFFFSFFVIWQVWQLKPRSVLAFLGPFALSSILAKMIFFWRKMKVVVNEDHYSSGIVPLYKYSLLNRWGMKRLYRRADAVISPTEMAKKDLVENFDVPSGKTILVPNWTSLARLKPKRLSEKYDFIYAGRFAKVKRIDLLLKTVAKLQKERKNFRVCLLGDGKEKAKLEELAKKLGIKRNVDFLGIQAVEKFLVQSKVFICFSQFGAEGFPLAILEAMAMATPVLSYRFAGASEVIKEGENGFLFDSKKEFLFKAGWLLKNPQRRRTIGKKAKEYVQEYHSLSNIKYYLQALGI